VTKRKLYMIGLVLLLTVTSRVQVAEADSSPAEQQLELAEAALAAGDPEGASQAAVSALRLDSDLHRALVTKGLAARALGRSAEARALLRTYLDLHEGPEPDPRVGPALVSLAAELGPFEIGSTLSAADTAILELETPVAEAHLRAVRRAGVEGETLKRVIELEALAAWTDERPEDAKGKWAELFTAFPESVVNPDLQPDAMRLMAQAQGEVRDAKPDAVPAQSRREPPHAAALFLLGAGGGAAAFGFVFSRASHDQGMNLYPGLEADAVSWDANIDGYNDFRTREGVGAAVAAAGSAALVGGLVSLLVDRAVKETRRGREATP
jgi:hypothetical protein